MSLTPCRSRVRKLLEAFGCFLHDYGEIGPLVDLAHFDDLVVGHRCLPGPFERLFPRTHLNDPVASDNLFGLSERYFCNRCLAVRVGNKCSGRRGRSPSSPSSTSAFCRLLLYSIILATASAPGAASPSAVSYPLRTTTIMKRIHISFIIDARQHWLAH